MKKIFLVTTFAIFSSYSIVAQAADSMWLLCSNNTFVVNSFEHRSASGAGRETSLNLILGGHIFAGKLTDTDSGQVLLAGTETEENNFTGNVSVNYHRKSLVLKGTLSIQGEDFKVNSTLHCKEMRPQL